MTERPQYTPDLEHMAVFGTIVQSFARHEFLMQGIMAALLNVPLSNAALITAGLGYSGKRDALLSLLRDVSLPDDQVERIRWFLGELHKHNQLRNHIAHSLWKPGTRHGTIKPVGAIARGGLARFLGSDPNEEDWSLRDLATIADELSTNYNRFLDYAEKASLIPPRMAAKTEQRSSPTSSSEGTPSAK